MTIYFNLLGLGMFAAAWTAAFGLSAASGITGQGPMMIVAGPIALLLDGLYRWRHPTGHWIHPEGGGSVLFVPLWVFGVLWLLGGILYTATGREEPGVLGGILIGLVALAILVAAVAKHMPSEESSSGYAPKEEWDCSRCGHKNPARSQRCKSCHLELS